MHERALGSLAGLGTRKGNNSGENDKGLVAEIVTVRDGYNSGVLTV